MFHVPVLIDQRFEIELLIPKNEEAISFYK